MSYIQFKGEHHGTTASIFRFESREYYYSLAFGYVTRDWLAELCMKGKASGVSAPRIVEALQHATPDDAMARAMANAIRMTRAK